MTTAGRAGAAGIGAGPHPEPNHSHPPTLEPAVPDTTNPQTDELLRRTESYLSALHGSVARHDNLAANLACAGCELRDQIRAALAAVPAPSPAPADQAAEPVCKFEEGCHRVVPCEPGCGASVDWAVVAYRSPGTRTLYCVICARRESGWQPVTADVLPDVDTVCDFCGGRVLAVASRTLGDVVARYMPAAAPGRVVGGAQQDKTQTDDTVQLAKVVRWVTSEVVSAQTEFGNGYRAAQRDIRDLIKGRFDDDARPAVVSQPGKEA